MKSSGTIGSSRYDDYRILGERPLVMGDIVRCVDGSIGIVDSVILGEDGFRFSMKNLLNFKMSKNAWWDDSEVSEIVKGPLHAVLAGETRLKLK